jgi:hypothetical protein
MSSMPKAKRVSSHDAANEPSSSAADGEASSTPAPKKPRVGGGKQKEVAGLLEVAEEEAAAGSAGGAAVGDAADGDDSAQPAAKKARKSKGKAVAERSGEQQPFENGVLRSIVLENFMNHAHMRVDFDPHVNFIVGANGSGKSAIVAGLITAFGHNAKTTGRNTSSSKSLIMNGKSHARIQVHLANGGEDPYKPEEFGDTIIAEHTLERSGAGSYKLRDSAEGAKPRRSSKAEFEQMCVHFNIQANNPCVLLTQEHAKAFLHKGNEHDRYKFFLQAANLETRKNDLAATLANVQLLEQRLHRAEAGMADKIEFAEKAQAEYEGAERL